MQGQEPEKGKPGAGSGGNVDPRHLMEETHSAIERIRQLIVRRMLQAFRSSGLK